MVDVQCSFVSISIKLAAFQAGGAETLTPLAQA